MEQAVVAVPLNEVGAAHEGSMLAGAAVVVPEVEVGEVDGVGEGRAGERAVLVQAVDDVFGGQDLCVGVGDHLLGLRVDAVDQGLRVALRADLFHAGLRAQIVGTFLADGVGQVPAEAVGGVVGYLQAVDAAHVTGGAGGHEHIAGTEGLGIGIELEQALLRGEHNAVLGFVVDLDLRVVGAHVALSAGGGETGESDGTGVAGVAGGAVADGAIFIGLADGVALLAAGGHGRTAFGGYEGMGRAVLCRRAGTAH